MNRLHSHALTAQFRLRQMHQFDRTITMHGAMCSKIVFQVIDIALLHRRGRAKHGNYAGLRNRCSGLDCWHGADNRSVERRTRRLQRNGRGGVAGDDDQ